MDLASLIIAGIALLVSVAVGGWTVKIARDERERCGGEQRQRWQLHGTSLPENRSRRWKDRAGHQVPTASTSSACISSTIMTSALGPSGNRLR